MIDFPLVLACIILPVLTAVGGLWRATQEGEKINWVIFIKTIIIGIVTAGFITQVEGELILAIASTEIITLILDTLVNAILNKTARTEMT